jgi:hypothetical protein
MIGIDGAMHDTIGTEYRENKLQSMRAADDEDEDEV